MYPLIFIVGPTATGKTKVAFHLARAIGAQIVSCDSMQVYKEPRVITAKPPQYMLDEIPHHFMGMISVGEQYNAFDYARKARAFIDDRHQNGESSVVCGGSGLYIKALLDGIFEGVSSNEEVRRQLVERIETEGLSSLYMQLREVDAAAAAKISPNDKKRIIRALEVYRVTGRPISAQQQDTHGLDGQIPLRVFGLRLDREELYARINTRVENMVMAGAAEEVRQLVQLGLSPTAEKIIGVTEMKKYLSGEFDLSQATDAMKQATRNYAKRQLTWFRKEKRITWIDSDKERPEGIAKTILSSLNEAIDDSARNITHNP